MNKTKGCLIANFATVPVKAGDYRTQSEVMRDALRLLREKQAESRLQQLRDLLAEGLSSGEAKPWNKDAFLNNVRARMANERD
ncbi:type II toxin-antitoxin system ParD family antitoxin [Escherichia coli]